MAVAKQAAKAQSAKKSGIKTFKPGEILFREKDVAESLFIIQRGQVRLFIPKGRGFVDIAILWAGEVIGEMAYFDEKARRRSCSAAAMVTTDVVEISFVAFEKTMQGLNPWFKTIINTLADRLRKTNAKVKELETNSVGVGYGDKVGDYVFFHNVDIVKFFSLVYLVFRAHGEVKDGANLLHLDRLKLYGMDIWNFPEVKYEEMMNLLKNLNYIEIANDESGLPKILKVKSIELFRQMMLFFNTQRQTEDSKKIKISPRCEQLLGKIIQQLSAPDAQVKEGEGFANLTKIFEEFKARNVAVSEEDLADAINAGLCGDIVVGAGNVLTTKVQYDRLQKIYPCFKVMNAIAEVNESKKNG